MIIECCSQEKIYSKFYGLIGERFCKMNRFWKSTFAEAFKTYYDTIHRYETNKIRNIAKFFAHILASDGLDWEVLDCVHLNEDETTASSRIFLKILFQDMVEETGIKTIVERFNDPDRDKQAAFRGILPRDNPSDTRFAINFFTIIGLGAVTEDLRDYLQMAMERAKEKI
jgi:pre-mRNA-splicing factor CWC22